MWGAVGSAGLFGLYVGAVAGLSRSLGHAWELLATDWPFVAALAGGFGARVGLYAHLRRLRRASGAVAGAAGFGTGTSTAAMVACCAHHATDLLPFLSLPAVTGVVGALAAWRVPLMTLGIVTNLVGVGVSLRLVQRARSDLGGTATGEGKAMAERVKDPVCGMEVDPERAATRSEYEGKTYYFCSAHCKTSFDRQPEQYAGQS
ncbi:MAG: YHS domain-containing protein [Armatimonadota bacterium]|nr:YHS domain-containing protein [Armatimonadota bacterium]MDR7390671.1 YHS domain-containing protein [Armatimonadota bacterium]MDR7395251.1 YHS domain-containing protein [Armatimonadota bacterium]MDR7396198.1 YHS domain-containing protein [Armatimonadota bacterium]MDR7399982.1 YHS domain-containing protein [Armatimonadota bacterium]